MLRVNKSSVGLTLFAGALTVYGWAGPGLESAEAQSCSGSAEFNERLASGARWEFCWSNDNARGLVITDVYYTTPRLERRKVAKNLSLAQIHVVTNDNQTRLSHASAGGLGGARLRTLVASECINGGLRATDGRNVLCHQVTDVGYSYKYYTSQKRSYALTVFAVSNLSTGSYITRYRFHDSGVIELAIGNSGVLPSTDAGDPFGWVIDSTGNRASGYINVYDWRLDLDVGSNPADDFVEQIDSVPSGALQTKTIAISRITTETGRNIDANTKRFWRIRDSSTVNADGHAASYELETLNDANRYTRIGTEPWAISDFYATKLDVCELLSSGNTGSGCGASLANYLNNESINGEDVVLWYRHAYYRLPSTEDWKSVKTKWRGFLIVPRDQTATNPLAFRVLPRQIEVARS